MTVRDEREMLRSNLRYHHFAGVTRCYVYDDGSADGTPETVADLPYVELHPSIDGMTAPVPSHLRDVDEASRQAFPYRQLLNVMDATARASAAGAAWLVAIDADELVAVELARAVPDGLRDLLGSQERRVEAVIFPTLEVVQRRARYADVMAEETLFKRPDIDIMRETYDPFEKRVRTVRAVYGHKQGKTAVRVSTDVVPINNHRFSTLGGSPLRAVEAGHLLHYYSHDWVAFVRKFRLMKDHPDHHVRGDRVVLQKRLWRDVVNRSGLDDNGLREYYERWVMFSDADVRRMSGRGWRPWRTPAFIEVTSARDTLRQIAGRSEAAGAPQ